MSCTPVSSGLPDGHGSKAPPPDGIRDGFENPAGGGQETRQGKMPAKADGGHGTAR